MNVRNVADQIAISCIGSSNSLGSTAKPGTSPSSIRLVADLMPSIPRSTKHMPSIDTVPAASERLLSIRCFGGRTVREIANNRDYETLTNYEYVTECSRAGTSVA